jgi:serine O-acetyltransferase
MWYDPDFSADMKRYPPRAVFREQSVWAIFIYRLGRRLFKRKPSLFRSVLLKIHSAFFRIVETSTGISLPVEAQIGPGLRIYHFGNIFVHPDAVIGRNCTLRHGVTIGNVGVQGPVPVIEDDVEFGAYAQVLGKVRVGRGAKIGTLTLVYDDVPAGATVMAGPGRILRRPPNPETPPIDRASE